MSTYFPKEGDIARKWFGDKNLTPYGYFRRRDRIMVSVRPEKLAITEPPAGIAAWNRLDGVVEVATFLGPVVRAEITVAGRPFFVDVPHGLAGAVARKKRLTLGFAPADCVVVATPSSGPTIVRQRSLRVAAIRSSASTCISSRLLQCSRPTKSIKRQPFSSG